MLKHATRRQKFTRKTKHAKKILHFISRFLLFAPDFGEDDNEDPGVIKMSDLPFSMEIQCNPQQPLEKKCQDYAVEGGLFSEADCSIKATVSPTRLRHASYRLGRLLAEDHPACLYTQRVTGVQYDTVETQRNCATPFIKAAVKCRN